MNSIAFYTQAIHDNQVNTTSYVDQFHQENERSRGDLRIDFYNQSSDFLKKIQNKFFDGNKLTNVVTLTVN